MSFHFINPPDTQMNKDLYNNEICGKCSRCGGCCNAAPLPVTKHEVRMIVDFVCNKRLNRLNRDWIPELNTPKTSDSPLNIDLSCCFYDQINKCCTIYPVRPAICKEFKCSNSVSKREEIKSRLHRIADYCHLETLTGVPTKITNFDLIIYGDIIPLQIYFQYFTGMTGKTFGEFFNDYGCHSSYSLLAHNQLNLK